MPSIKLQFLLRSDRRNEADRAAAADAVRALGMEVTGTGAASLSARIDEDVFKRLFGQAHLPASAGRGRGVSNESLPVPLQLQPFVASISVAPDHLYF